MGIFDSSILSTIRARLETYLNDTCTIESAASAIDAYGTPTQTWSTVAADTPCRVIRDNAQAGAAQQIASREALRHQYRLIVIVDVALGVNYRVTTSDGSIYDIVEVEANLTDSFYKSATIARRE